MNDSWKFPAALQVVDIGGDLFHFVILVLEQNQGRIQGLPWWSSG